MKPLDAQEFAAMERLLGGLVDHCDHRQQHLLLRLHRQLSALYQSQLSELDELARLRALHASNQSKDKHGRL